LKKDELKEETSYLEGAEDIKNSTPFKFNEFNAVTGQITAKADSALQYLSELKAILSDQKKGDISLLEDIIEKVKQFKKSLIEELKINDQSKSEMAAESIDSIHRNQKYKNLSGSVDEIIKKLYR
jgi:flagellar biosynthesis/type III secretory pathway chaperone